MPIHVQEPEDYFRDFSTRAKTDFKIVIVFSNTMLAQAELPVLICHLFRRRGSLL